MTADELLRRVENLVNERLAAVTSPHNVGEDMVDMPDAHATCLLLANGIIHESHTAELLKAMELATQDTVELSARTITLNESGSDQETMDEYLRTLWMRHVQILIVGVIYGREVERWSAKENAT